MINNFYKSCEKSCFHLSTSTPTTWPTATSEATTFLLITPPPRPRRSPASPASSRRSPSTSNSLRTYQDRSCARWLRNSWNVCSATNMIPCMIWKRQMYSRLGSVFCRQQRWPVVLEFTTGGSLLSTRGNWWSICRMWRCITQSR